MSVAVHTREYAPPAAVRPELPPAIDTWMARAFARDLDARFGRATDLAEAFVSALRMVEVPALPLPLPSVPLPSAPLPSGPALAPPARGAIEVAPAPARAARGAPIWLAALLGAVAIVSLAALGTVAYLALGADDGEREVASTSDGPARAKKKRAVTPEPDPDPDPEPSAKPAADPSRVELPRLYAQVNERVRAKRADAELVAIVAYGVDPLGRLRDESSLTFEFRSRAIGACVTVTFVAGAMSDQEGACMADLAVVATPRCTLGGVLRRLHGSLPAGTAAMTYAANLANGKPQWRVLVEPTVRTLPDDCS